MASAAPSPSYKILTYNTLIAYSHEGQNWCEKNLPALKTLSWDERRSRLVEKMVETDPDVITLQEVVDREGQATFKQFADSLSARGYTGQFGRRPDGEGCAIFYKTDRFQHITSRTIHLEGDRIAFMSRLRSIEGDIFNVASVHLNHNPSSAASQAAGLVKSIERERAEPTIITGDFNIRRDNSEYRHLDPLFHVGFTDPHPAVGLGTFRATEQTTLGRPGSDIGQFRIDYTLVSPSASASDPIVCGHPDDLQTADEPSDHLPAQVTVSFSHEARKSIQSILEEVRDGLADRFDASLENWNRNVPESVRNKVYGEVARLYEGDSYFGVGQHAFLKETGPDGQVKDVRNTVRRNAIDAVIAGLAGQSPSAAVSSIAVVDPAASARDALFAVTRDSLLEIKGALRQEDKPGVLGFHGALTKFQTQIPKAIQDATYGYVSTLGSKEVYFGQGQDAFLQNNGQDVGTTIREKAIVQAIANLESLL